MGQLGFRVCEIPVARRYPATGPTPTKISPVRGNLLFKVADILEKKFDQLGAEMINFGALFAFMGVNAAAFVRYFLRAKDRSLAGLLPPLLGFIICLLLWMNVGRTALTAGIVWLIAGLLFSAVKTKGFRAALELSAPLPEVE